MALHQPKTPKIPTIMKRFFLFLAILCTGFAAVAAQIIGSAVNVRVTPDHADWLYRTGEPITFSVSVEQSGVPLPDVEVTLQHGPEWYAEHNETKVLKNGTATVRAAMDTPGFYKLKATAHVGNRDYEAWCSVGVSPEKILPQAQCPADFDEFWAKTAADARQTPLEPHATFLPERSDADVLTYHVSFQNDRQGRRVYGILNIPARPGRYPALLRVPGAGVRPYTGDNWTCRQGVIVLEIGIHGIPVCEPQQFYSNLVSAALADYWHNGIHDRRRNYYRHVVTGCLRAVDLIAALDGLAPLLHGSAAAWDGRNLAVTGSSQGGFLSLATAALDRRVSCYGAVHAALCDLEAAARRKPCGWPHYFYDEAAGKPLDAPDAHLMAELRYYDGVNFARRIAVPGFFSFGYNDNVVPPTTAYATYNVAGGEKTLAPYPATAHYWHSEQWDEWQQFLLRHLLAKGAE